VYAIAARRYTPADDVAEHAAAAGRPGRAVGRSARPPSPRVRGSRPARHHPARARGLHRADRTRLYRHFDGAADLQHAIACRVAELITAEFAPLWQPSGTPMDLIRTAIGAHTRWLAEHGPLYRYLTKHAVDGAPDVFADGKTAIARQLTVVFEHYLGLFGIDTRVCEAVAFGLVGLVETSTSRWLENPRGVDRAELAALLARWVWGIVDDTLRRGGLELDPHTRLEAADLSAWSTVDS
jgi:hypothetical protein